MRKQLTDQQTQLSMKNQQVHDEIRKHQQEIHSE